LTPSRVPAATSNLIEVTPGHDASSRTSIWHIRGLKLGALGRQGGVFAHGVVSGVVRGDPQKGRGGRQAV